MTSRIILFLKKIHVSGYNCVPPRYSDFRLLHKNQSALLNYPANQDNQFKPDDLMANLNKALCSRGGTVLDTHIGGGALMRAVLKAKQPYIGFESDRYLFDEAVGSLKNYRYLYYVKRRQEEMKFNIYHTLTLAHPFELPSPTQENYKLVGQVQVRNVEEAYAATQNLGPGGWALNNTSTMSKADRIRSTSVGDIAVAEDGTAHRFEMVGTSKVDFTLPTLEGRQEDGLKKFSGLNFFF
jgi:hypothetical protein